MILDTGFHWEPEAQAGVRSCPLGRKGRLGLDLSQAAGSPILMFISAVVLVLSAPTLRHLSLLWPGALYLSGVPGWAFEMGLLSQKLPWLWVSSDFRDFFPATLHSGSYSPPSTAKCDT